MKQLENLDDKLPYPDADLLTPEELAREIELMPTYRRLLRHLCMQARAKDVEDADRCDQARLKLSQKDSTVLLEDVEFSALYNRVKENPLQWFNYNYSRMLEYMRIAEQKKVEIVTKS